MAFSEPGDAILLQLPSYPPFMRAIEDTGRRLIANPMRDDGTRWVLGPPHGAALRLAHRSRRHGLGRL
jgi:bifunctional pyridoxal-dependent enzyme with beta-cystathionase and maltose regulon repressor activities